MLERGDQIKDNDRRMPSRILTVIGFEIEPGDPYRVRVVCEDRSFRKPKTFRIKADRIFDDEKPRSYGFSKMLVTNPMKGES
ncbi:hypothetical protein ACVWW1_000788 [Bradyrhizobium sp. JR3.5]